MLYSNFTKILSDTFSHSQKSYMASKPRPTTPSNTNTNPQFCSERDHAMLIRYVSMEMTPSIDRKPFPFILNDKCYYLVGPHWVWWTRYEDLLPFCPPFLLCFSSVSGVILSILCFPFSIYVPSCLGLDGWDGLCSRFMMKRPKDASDDCWFGCRCPFRSSFPFWL